MRFDAVEVKASEDLGGGEPLRVRADAGQVLHDWQGAGSVGIPYLLTYGELQYGATEAGGSVADAVERGQVVED